MSLFARAHSRIACSRGYIISHLQFFQAFLTYRKPVQVDRERSWIVYDNFWFLSNFHGSGVITCKIWDAKSAQTALSYWPFGYFIVKVHLGYCCRPIVTLSMTFLLQPEIFIWPQNSWNRFTVSLLEKTNFIRLAWL